MCAVSFLQSSMAASLFSIHATATLVMQLEAVHDEAENLHVLLRFSEDNPYLETTEFKRIINFHDPNGDCFISELSWKPGQVRVHYHGRAVAKKFEMCLSHHTDCVQQLSPSTDDSKAGTFASCNFFQRLTSLPQFDAVDRILHDMCWDPVTYYNGQAVWSSLAGYQEP
jgi:hypothetical protein